MASAWLKKRNAKVGADRCSDVTVEEEPQGQQSAAPGVPFGKRGTVIPVGASTIRRAGFSFVVRNSDLTTPASQVTSARSSISFSRRSSSTFKDDVSTPSSQVAQDLKVMEMEDASDAGSNVGITPSDVDLMELPPAPDHDRMSGFSDMTDSSRSQYSAWMHSRRQSPRLPGPLMVGRERSTGSQSSAWMTSRRRSSQAMSHALSMRRRSRRWSDRRISRLASIINLPEALSLNPVSSGGALFDFLIRISARKRQVHDQVMLELNELCRKDLQLEYDPKHKHKDAVAIFLKEALHCIIVKALTPELKSQRYNNHKGWTHVRPERLPELGATILRHKRELTCLTVEVDYWAARYALLTRQAHQQENSNEKFQKTGKVVAFWLDYHGRTWDDGEVAPAPKSKMPNSASLPCLSQDSAKDPSLAQSRPTRLPPLRGTAAVGRGPGLQGPALSGGRAKAGNALQTQSTGQLHRTIPGEKASRSTSSRKRYLGACEAASTAPKTLHFTTGHTQKLTAAGRHLLDRDLLAIAEMLPSAVIEEVDLNGSKSLTDKSLVPFLGSLLKGQAVKTLKKLNLGHCVRTALGTQRMVMEVLQAIEGLRLLDISSVRIAVKQQWLLCEAIRDHAYLETVNLSDIGLGLTPRTKDCVSALGSSKLKTLDLAWNTFNAAEFICLADQLRYNDFLWCLGLSKTSSRGDGSDLPISYFLEHLGRVKSLKSLDISMNSIDYQASLILEDALEGHRCLTHLNLSDNCLGVYGLRSILRLLSSGKGELVYFETDDSYLGVNPTGDRQQVFSALNPGSRYTFDLTRPYHRTFLRMLYRSSERFGLPPEQTFLHIVSSPFHYRHATKDSEGVWQVPTQGTVTLTFSVERAMEAAVKNVTDDDFSGFLRRTYQFARIRPAFTKIVPLMARWKELSIKEQEIFLKALSKDFSLTLAQVTFMCQFSSRTDEVIETLLPCLPGSRIAEYLSGVIIPNVSLFIGWKERLRHFFDLNIDNPTGRYHLNLEKSCDYFVASSLLLLDRWEVLVDRRRKRFDLSSMGNHSHLRNEHYRSQELSKVCENWNIAEWTLPEVDHFDFDYASSARPAHNVEVLSEDAFNGLLTDLSDSTAPPDRKLSVLRAVSSHIYLASMQLRQMLGMFKRKEERAEVFVMFYFRIVDMQNSKVFRVRFASSEEIQKLQRRLGYAAFFPYIQPENNRFELDMAFHDQRLCVSLLVQLALKEKQGNLRDPKYTHVDGTEDPLAQGVPRSWEMIDRVPSSGLFTASYVCAPEDRLYDLRRKLGLTYGYFRTDVVEAQVLWWTGLNEAPADVIVFLEFLIAQVSSVAEAFHRLGGESNELITLRMMEEGIEEMGCKKFEGEDKFDRIQAIFRYLDTGKEGSVSWSEFQVLSQLWNEYEYCCCEFVQFLVRTFNENLEDAWEELLPDDDNSSFSDSDDDKVKELSHDDFITAVEELGYFGQTSIIFKLLDTNDSLSISVDEFLVLERFRRLPNLTRKAGESTCGGSRAGES